MSFIELIVLSFAVAMDAFSAGVIDGMTFDKINFPRALIISVIFGFFFTLFSAVGFFASYLLINKFFLESIIRVRHLIVLVSFCLLAFRMFLYGVSEIFDKHTANILDVASPDTRKQHINEKMTLGRVFAQATAQGADKLLLGLALAAIDINFYQFPIFIFSVTALLCFPAIFIGKKIGDALTDKSEFFGGIILVALAIKFFLMR